MEWGLDRPIGRAQCPGCNKIVPVMRGMLDEKSGALRFALHDEGDPEQIIRRYCIESGRIIPAGIAVEEIA